MVYQSPAPLFLPKGHWSGPQKTTLPPLLSGIAVDRRHFFVSSMIQRASCHPFSMSAGEASEHEVGFQAIGQGAVAVSKTGWWFGTCFIFPYIGNNQNWLIFLRGVQTTNQLPVFFCFGNVRKAWWTSFRHGPKNIKRVKLWQCGHDTSWHVMTPL